MANTNNNISLDVLLSGFAGLDQKQLNDAISFAETINSKEGKSFIHNISSFGKLLSDVDEEIKSNFSNGIKSLIDGVGKGGISNGKSRNTLNMGKDVLDGDIDNILNKHTIENAKIVDSTGVIGTSVVSLIYVITNLFQHIEKLNNILTGDFYHSLTSLVVNFQKVFSNDVLKSFRTVFSSIYSFLQNILDGLPVLGKGINNFGTEIFDIYNNFISTLEIFKGIKNSSGIFKNIDKIIENIESLGSNKRLFKSVSGLIFNISNSIKSAIEENLPEISKTNELFINTIRKVLEILSLITGSTGGDKKSKSPSLFSNILKFQIHLRVLTKLNIGKSLYLLLSSLKIDEGKSTELDNSINTFAEFLKKLVKFSADVLKTVQNVQKTFLEIFLTGNIILLSLSQFPILFLGIYSLLSLFSSKDKSKISLSSFITTDIDFLGIRDKIRDLSNVFSELGDIFLIITKTSFYSITFLFTIRILESAINGLFSFLKYIGTFEKLDLDFDIFNDLSGLSGHLLDVFKKFSEISLYSIIVSKSIKHIKNGLNSVFDIFWGEGLLQFSLIDFENLEKSLNGSNNIINKLDFLFKNIVDNIVPSAKKLQTETKNLNKSFNDIFKLLENIIKKSNRISELAQNAIQSISYISIVINSLLTEFNSFLSVNEIYLTKIQLTKKILTSFIVVANYIIFVGFLSLFANILFKPLNIFVTRVISFISQLDSIKDIKKSQKNVIRLKVLFSALTSTLLFVIISGILSIPATMALLPLSIFVFSLSLFLKLLSSQLTTITKGLFILKGISFVMFLLSISLITFSLASKSLSIGTMLLSIVFIGALIGISALAGLLSPYLTTGIISLIGLSLILPILGLGLLLFAGAIKVWTGDMIKSAVILFLSLLPAMMIFGIGGIIASPGLLLLGVAFSVLSVGLLLLALAVSIWSVTKLADSMADIFLKIRLGIEALLERPGGIRSAFYNIPILGTYMQMWDSVVQSIGLLMLGVSFVFLGVGLLLLGLSVVLWKNTGIADSLTDIMKKIRTSIEALLERPNLQGSGIYSVPLFGTFIQLFDSVLQSIGLLVIGVSMSLLGVGLLLLGLSVVLWKNTGIADSLTDIMKKIRTSIEALLERPNLQGSGIYSVPLFGTYMQLFDSVLQSIGLLVIGVSMSLLGVGLLLLGLSVMLWKGKNLSDDFYNLMTSIREGINGLLQSGGNISSSGIYDIPIIGTFIQLFDSLVQSISIVLISVSLLILSLSLTTLGKAIENWNGEKVNILPSIMLGIKNGIDVLLYGSEKSGNSIETVSTGSQTIDSILKLISVTSQSIGIIFISGALILLSKALEYLGEGINKIGDKWKQFPVMMKSINEGINVLLGDGEGGTFDNGILGAAAGLVVGSDNVDAGGKVAKMAAIAGGLVLLGKSFQVLGSGLSSFPENSLSIFSDIGNSIKNLTGSISEDIINNLSKLSEPLKDIGVSFSVFGSGISQISYGLSRISWSETNKSPLIQFSDGIKRLLLDLSNIPISNLKNVPDILRQVGDSLKIFGFGVSEISYGLSRLKWQEDSSPMLQFGDGLVHIFNSLGNENINEKNIKNFTNIADQFVKFSNSASGFKSFKDTFKEFVKDFKTFTETLNNIDINKLKGWTSFNKISLDIISNKENKVLEQYSEEMKSIIRAFFEELNAREERLSALETTGDTFNYERFRQIMLEVLQGLNTGNKGGTGSFSNDITMIAEKFGQTAINYINKQR